jgi:hypothetical protein
MKRILIIAATALGATLLATTLGHAATNGYDLDWFTVNGGGSTASGGEYSVHATMGQADAGQLDGGSYVISSGFWQANTSSRMFLPLVQH